MSIKRARRAILFVIVLGAALYFIPILTLILVVCGALDVSRHRKITYDLIEKYFMGNGVGTWFLSPLNLLADLFSFRNKGQYALADLPESHREEIEACVRALVDNGDELKAHIARTLGQNKRAMLTFKWYDAKQTTDVKIPAFEKEYRYIKTIALSVFNTRERTSWHFGPLRLTFRVLYNLDPRGGYESLAIPFDCTSLRTATRWAPGGPTVRFHIGLEAVEDLIADLERGFAALAQAARA